MDGITEALEETREIEELPEDEREERLQEKLHAYEDDDEELTAEDLERQRLWALDDVRSSEAMLSELQKLSDECAGRQKGGKHGHI